MPNCPLDPRGDRPVRQIAVIFSLLLLFAAFGWWLGRGHQDPVPEKPAAGLQSLAEPVDAEAAPADRSAAFSPEAGRWVGIPRLATQRAPVHPVIVPRNDWKQIPATEAKPLAEYLDEFDALPSAARAKAASIIASAWEFCLDYRFRTEAEILEAAIRSRDWYEKRAAEQALEEEDLESLEQLEIWFESMSRQEHIDLMHLDMTEEQRICAGIEEMTREARKTEMMRWIERAAEFGHAAARLRWLSEILPTLRAAGRAREAVAIKQTALSYLAEALSRRDARALFHLSQLTAEGYFERPNAVHALAYARAARDALHSGSETVWSPPSTADEDVLDAFRRLLDERITELESALDPGRQRAADRIAERILRLEETH